MFGPDGVSVTDSVGIPSRLLFVERDTRRQVPSIYGLTVQEMNDQAASIPSGFTNVIVAKQFQIQVGFIATGSTPVTNLRFAIDSKMPDSGVWNDGGWSQPMNLSPGKRVFKITELITDINARLPDKLAFRVRVEYTNAADEQVSNTTPFYYDSQTGAFNIGS